MQERFGGVTIGCVTQDANNLKTNKMEVQGKIIVLEGIETGTSKAGKDWKKQEFVIETDEQYPRKIAMSVFGDKVDALSYYSVGMQIKCKIQVESKEWQGRWYTAINAWHIAGVK